MKSKIIAWEKSMNEINEKLTRTVYELEKLPLKEGCWFASPCDAISHPVIVGMGCKLQTDNLQKIAEALEFELFDEETVWIPMASKLSDFTELEEIWYSWDCPEDLDDIGLIMDGFHY